MFKLYFIDFMYLEKKNQFLNFGLILISFQIMIIFIHSKNSIDKACKDKECKYYKNEFKIEVHFADV